MEPDFPKTPPPFPRAEPAGEEIDPFASAHEVVEHVREATAEEAEHVKASRSFWLELPFLIVVALIIAVLIKTFAFQAFYIPSGSMEDTLQINDRVMVSKLSYVIGDVDNGDVIVFDDPRGARGPQESIVGALFRNLAESIGLRTPQSEFIKRVIAVEGQTVHITDNVVFVDGLPIDEPYLAPGTRMPEFEEITVPQGEVFVMGDNRANSTDSRAFGTIPAEDIVGRAFVVIWPVSNWSGL
jgi:signal peptidase I